MQSRMKVSLCFHDRSHYLAVAFESSLLALLAASGELLAA
jgi:hypothetical protein